MADNPRIEELRRRVETDPASIAFAQLAEEYRRAGSYEEAVATCRAGLAIHPSYLSARVTLGRSLVEVHALEEAETELRQVLQHAPENLAAIRSLAEIHHRRGELDQALTLYKSAMGIARHDPDLEQTVDEISRAVTRAKPPVSDGMSLEEIKNEFTEFLDSFAQPAPKADRVPEPQTGPELEAAPKPQLEAAARLHLVPQLQVPPQVAEQPALTPEAQIAPEPPLAIDRELDTEPGLEGQPGFEAAPDPETESAPQSIGNPALPGLERFLVAIHSYRQRRAV